MNKVFRKIGTNETFPLSTLSVKREVVFTKVVDKQLYDAEGNRLSIAALAELGLEILVTPTQTNEYYEYHQFTKLFEVNPDLETRVLEYKEFFDQLGIAYDSNTDAMEAAIMQKLPGDENKTARMEYIQRMQTALTNVKVNYQASISLVGGIEYAGGAVTGNDFETWLHTPLLIKYMPASNPAEPEFREQYIATEETEAAEKAELEALAEQIAAEEAAPLPEGMVSAEPEIEESEGSEEPIEG